MTSILTIILVSLILSCIDNVICEQNISYKFQLNYGPILDFVHYTPLDQESIVQSSRPVFLDLLVVVTMNACDYCGSQFHNITQYIELLFHSASKIFSMHKITLSVVKTDFWCLKNKVKTSNQLNTKAFTNYFSSIRPRPDALVVFEDVTDRYYLGGAKIGQVCSKYGIAIIDLCRKSKFNPKKVGETLAHELGHLLGLNDIEESDKNCKCGTPGLNFCVMFWREDPWHGNYPRSFTACEMKKIESNLKDYNCLLTKYKAPRLYGTCGDGIVGEDEDCDSGYLDRDHKIFSENECCDHKTCKYKKKQYKCWYGKCCEKCAISKVKLCRKSVSECDRAESCDGISNECPKDWYKNKFEMCKNSLGFCYLKSCLNIDVMCRIGYKKKDAYFSINCAKALVNIMKNECPTPENGTEFNRIVCRRNALCDHFVCGIPDGFNVPGALYFLGSNPRERCLIPKKNNRDGLTSKAPMYMNCGFHSKYPKFCYNRKCTNSSKVLKNCKRDTCRNMNVKFRSLIDPDSGISRFLKTGTFIFLSENEKNQSLQNSLKTKLSFIISIPIILLLSILILLRKNCKKNWLNLNTQTN